MNTSFLRVNMSHKYKMSELSNGKIIQERFQGAPWFANTHDARCRSNARWEITLEVPSPLDARWKVTLDAIYARLEITLEVPSQIWTFGSKWLERRKMKKKRELQKMVRKCQMLRKRNEAYYNYFFCLIQFY